MFVMLLSKTYLKRPYRRADIMVTIFPLVMIVEIFSRAWFISSLSEGCREGKD